MLANDSTDLLETSSAVKKSFGLVFTMGMICGVPANLLALVYFCKRQSNPASNKRYMTLLYRVITLVDTLICLLVFPLVESLWRISRDEDEKTNNARQGGRINNDTLQSLPTLFGEPTFCTIWGLLWNVLSVLSVYLVGILSFSRCQLLLHPLSTLNIFRPALLLSFLTLFIVVEKLVAHLATSSFYKGVEYGFDRKLGVCYVLSEENSSDYILAQSVMFTILLGLPVLPIIGSFVVSVYKLREARMRERKVKSGDTSKHRQATTTVILITGMYILCNLPVLSFYMFIWVGGYTCFFKALSEDLEGQKKICAGSSLRKRELLMMSMIWVACYTLLVLINSTLNPLIYFTRIKELRDSLAKQRDTILRRFKRVDSNVEEDMREEIIRTLGMRTSKCEKLLRRTFYFVCG